MKQTEIIRRAIVTEKTTLLRESGQIIAFEVAKDATKIDVKRAVENLLGAKVAEVRTVSVHGKVKRQGQFFGRRPDWKKAYVRLKVGEQVPDFLEGA
tara:strand:- start:22 stop:312 length:291 start_codon:yes stop_codon:yes gene_type:complete